MDERYSEIIKSKPVEISDPEKRTSLISDIDSRSDCLLSDMNGSIPGKCSRCSMIYERYDSHEVEEEKESLIKKILTLEWAMFQLVENEDGRAICQDSPDVFKVMRSSQAKSWTVAVLRSYLEDLEMAKRESRNLLSEKYARMMQYTRPTRYAEIAWKLPELEQGVNSLIERLVGIMVRWEQELETKYPNVLREGRPITSADDSPWVTSFETYMRGELMTYSKKTLTLYLNDVLEQEKYGKNGAETILLNTVRQYGFETLQEANEKIEQEKEQDI